jgi:hypothetical protein
MNTLKNEAEKASKVTRRIDAFVQHPHNNKNPRIQPKIDRMSLDPKPSITWPNVVAWQREARRMGNRFNGFIQVGLYSASLARGPTAFPCSAKCPPGQSARRELAGS